MWCTALLVGALVLGLHRPVDPIRLVIYLLGHFLVLTVSFAAASIWRISFNELLTGRMLPDNCQAPKMHILLAVIVLCALICNCHAQTCGREMLSYNFNDRQGPFTNWTKADVWKVWPQGVARKDFRGDEQIPGVIYTKGLHRASIGLGQLRLLMPKVLLQLSHSVSIHCSWLFCFSFFVYVKFSLLVADPDLVWTCMTRGLVAAGASQVLQTVSGTRSHFLEFVNLSADAPSHLYEFVKDAPDRVTV